MISGQLVDRGGSNFRNTAAGVSGKLFQEVINQIGDILLALPQRRQVDRQHIQPVVEVLAKCPLFQRRPQVLVGRGNDSNVHLSRLGAAQAFEFALLQHP